MKKGDEYDLYLGEEEEEFRHCLIGLKIRPWFSIFRMPGSQLFLFCFPRLKCKSLCFSPSNKFASVQLRFHQVYDAQNSLSA